MQTDCNIHLCSDILEVTTFARYLRQDSDSLKNSCVDGSMHNEQLRDAPRLRAVRQEQTQDHRCLHRLGSEED
jgi:hypothetical protein